MFYVCSLRSLITHITGLNKGLQDYIWEDGFKTQLNKVKQYSRWLHGAERVQDWLSTYRFFEWVITQYRCVFGIKAPIPIPIHPTLLLMELECRARRECMRHCTSPRYTSILELFQPTPAYFILISNTYVARISCWLGIEPALQLPFGTALDPESPSYYVDLWPDFYNWQNQTSCQP